MEAITNITKQVLEEFYGIKSEIIGYRLNGISANALIIYLPEARDALSGLQGFTKITVVCNCHVPEPLWQLMQEGKHDWQIYLREVLGKVIGKPHLSLDNLVILATTVNMEHLSWAIEVFEELWVLTFVTAGVKKNAMRIGKDRASYIERNGQFPKLGTINTILLTSASLDLAALAASFITITEAKVAALQELDIKSSYHPELQATGTGTDQIVVISGKMNKCTYVGGHTKIGEMMARAVNRATVGAIRNGLSGVAQSI